MWRWVRTKESIEVESEHWSSGMPHLFTVRPFVKIAWFLELRSRKILSHCHRVCKVHIILMEMMMVNTHLL